MIAIVQQKCNRRMGEITLLWIMSILRNYVLNWQCGSKSVDAQVLLNIT